MSDKFNEVFAKRLFYHMYTNKMTQKALADEVGVSEASVCNWLKGTKVPRADKVDKICHVLGCKRSDLVDEPSPDKYELTSIEREFIDNFHNLDSDSQSLVESLVKLLQAEQPDSDKVLEMIGRLSAILHS